MSCPYEIDVVRWVTGDTRLNELERVERHVAECTGCRAKAEALRGVLSRIGQPPAPATSGESSPKVFVESVMEKINRDRGVRRRSPAVRRLALAAGFVLPLALFGGWTAYRMNRADAPLGVSAVGGRASVAPVECTLLVLREGRSFEARATPLRATDELVVRYDNPGTQPMHVVVAAVDASGHVRTFYPSGALPGASAMPMAARSTGQLGDRPTSVEAWPRVPIRVVAVSFDAPRDADAVEASLRGRPVAEAAAPLFPGAIVREWLLSWESSR